MTSVPLLLRRACSSARNKVAILLAGPSCKHVTAQVIQKPSVFSGNFGAGGPLTPEGTATRTAPHVWPRSVRIDVVAVSLFSSGLVADGNVARRAALTELSRLGSLD